MSRPVVVVDLETSALAPNEPPLGCATTWETWASGAFTSPYGAAIEVAWWNLATWGFGSFVPAHNVRAVRAFGSAEALVVSRYLERIADREQDNGTAVAALHEQLRGATLAGANPAFDARFLRALFGRYHTTRDTPEPWHYRLLDVSAYAAGALGLPGGELPGLARVCELVDVDPPDHTAAGDVQACGECLIRLGAVQRPEVAA